MLSELIIAIQFFLEQYNLRLANPEGLLLLLAIPLFIVLGLWMGKELSWYRRLLIQLLRAVVITLLAIALAQPIKISKEKSPAVVVLADLSDSMSSDVRQQMETKIRKLWNERQEAPTYLVGFGNQPFLLASSESKRVGLPDQLGEDITDIAAALRFTYGLFPPQHDKRVVLFSDGLETQGSLLEEAVRARDMDIKLSTFCPRPQSAAEVRAQKVIAPATARTGDSVFVDVELYSNSRQHVSVKLLLAGKQIDSRKLILEPGVNNVDFSVKMIEPGWQELTAKVWTKSDRYLQNNSSATRIHVTKKPKVLLIQKTREENPLKNLLTGQEMSLDARSVEEIPSNLKDLSENDLIILDDLDLSQLPVEVTTALKKYVEELGGGLLVITGKSSGKIAGPQDYPIEQLLPVKFRQVKKKEKIPAALVFVIDRSSSMGRSRKFVILLRAVADALERLKDSAQVSLIMFDDFPEVIVPLVEARQRKKIEKILMSQRIGGGTSIFPALQSAHKELKKSAAKLKHVILLSDGQSISLFAHYGYIVQKMAKQNITISTVALGDDADQDELKLIASSSGGRFYFTNSIANVPKIFSAETENITESNVVEQSIRILATKLVEVISGIDFENAPAIGGYMASEALPTSEVILESSDRGEPILARWRFGLGKVTIVTTDAQGGWSRDWADWEGFNTLWPRLVKDTLRQTPPGDIRLNGSVQGDRAILIARVPSEKPDQEPRPPRIVVYDPDQKQADLTVVRRGLGVYRADLVLDKLGPYSFMAEREGEQGVKEVAYSSMSRTWREEYLSAETNPFLLKRAAGITGGEYEPEAEEIFGPGRQEREKREEKWPLFVFLGLLVFLAEVLIRRL
jgi:hypothetical protein